MHTIQQESSIVYANKERSAVYALSADPMTHGHINIVERTSRYFDHIIVGIGRNHDKRSVACGDGLVITL